MIDLRDEPLARPFRLGNGERACLLLHGFTGTPAEVRPIGERLARRGYTALGPLLPGHGTRVDDLAHARWEEWYACALEAWDELGRTSRRRAVAGLSMGALLALHLACERNGEVAAVAVLAPALRLVNQRAAAQASWVSRVPFLPRRLAIVPKEQGLPPERVRKTPNYDEIPLGALASMIRLQHLVLGELPSVRAPILILEGGRDRTVAAGVGETVALRIGSAKKRKILFPESGHILTEEPGASEVLDAIDRFFDETLGA